MRAPLAPTPIIEFAAGCSVVLKPSEFTSASPKDSGRDRENGMDAIREYLQVKSVWINTGAATAKPFVLR